MTNREIAQIAVESRVDQFYHAEGPALYSHADETEKLLLAAKAFDLKSKASLCLVSVLEENPIDITAAAPWRPAYNWRNLHIETIMCAARKEFSANSVWQNSSVATERTLC
jgi:hypothetical protein